MASPTGMKSHPTCTLMANRAGRVPVPICVPITTPTTCVKAAPRSQERGQKREAADDREQQESPDGTHERSQKEFYGGPEGGVFGEGHQQGYQGHKRQNIAQGQLNGLPGGIAQKGEHLTCPQGQADFPYGQALYPARCGGWWRTTGGETGKGGETGSGTVRISARASSERVTPET